MTYKLIITVNKELMDAIEDYWFKNRISNRTEACRRLMQDGLMMNRPTPPELKKNDSPDF